MKNLEFYLDDETSYTFAPCSAEFIIRGVVAFATDLEPGSLDPIFDLIYNLMEGERGIDAGGEEYKVATLKIGHDGEFEPCDASDTSDLSIHYGLGVNGELGKMALKIPEAAMVEFWEKKSEALKSAASNATGKDRLTLSMMIEALCLVSGEPAEFPAAFHSWAEAHDRNTEVRLSTILPLAA